MTTTTAFLGDDNYADADERHRGVERRAGAADCPLIDAYRQALFVVTSGGAPAPALEPEEPDNRDAAAELPTALGDGPAPNQECVQTELRGRVVPGTP